MSLLAALATAPSAQAIEVCGDSQDDVDVGGGTYICIHTRPTLEACAVAYVDADDSGDYSMGDPAFGPCLP